MTALTQDYNALKKKGDLVEYGVIASDIVYQGSLVGIDQGNATTGGYIQPLSDAEGMVFVGVAAEQGDNSSGVANAVKVDVYKTGVYRFGFQGGAPTRFDIGRLAVAVDDNTVEVGTGNAASSKFGIVVGAIVALDPEDSTKVFVRIDGYTDRFKAEYSYPAAVVSITRGNLVCENAAGFATNGADTANFQFLGIAIESVDNSGGSAGDEDVRVVTEGIWELTATQALSNYTIGDLVYVDGASTVDLATGTANVDAFVGRVVEKGASSTLYVKIAQLNS